MQRRHIVRYFTGGWVCRTQPLGATTGMPVMLWQIFLCLRLSMQRRHIVGYFTGGWVCRTQPLGHACQALADFCSLKA